MVSESLTGGIALLAGRILFGAVLAFMGLNHFLNLEEMSGYAEFKGLPAPTLAVAGSGAVLILGGLSVAAGIYPAVGAGLVLLFFVVATPTMHDFWAQEDPDEQQNELTHFLKNVVMAGGALVVLDVSASNWPYAVGMGL